VSLETVAVVSGGFHDHFYQSGYKGAADMFVCIWVVVNCLLYNAEYCKHHTAAKE
jgi:hypothetical protein